ncbi:MAG: hypothetical protein ACKO0Z_02305 [Betaproteobacteria bacterium]
MNNTPNVSATLNVRVEALTGMTGLEWLAENTIFQAAPVRSEVPEVAATMRRVMPKFDAGKPVISVDGDLQLNHWAYAVTRGIMDNRNNKAMVARLNGEFVTLALVRTPAKFNALSQDDSPFKAYPHVGGSPFGLEFVDLLDLASNGTTRGVSIMDAVARWCDARKAHRTYLMWLTKDTVFNAPRTDEYYAAGKHGVLAPRDVQLYGLRTAFVTSSNKRKVGTCSAYLGARFHSFHSFHTLHMAATALFHHMLSVSAPLAFANKGISAYLLCRDSNAPILREYIPTSTFSDWQALYHTITCAVADVAPPDSPLKLMRHGVHIEQALDDCVLSHAALQRAWNKALHQSQRAPNQKVCETIMLPMV